MNKRVQALRRRLADDGIEAIIITNPQNRRYLSGFTGSAGYLVITLDCDFIVTDFRYWDQAELQAPGYELVKLSGQPVKEWLGGIIQKIQPGNLGFEADDMTFSTYDLLKQTVGGIEVSLRPKLVPTRELVEAIRIYKDEDELMLISRAVDIADLAMVQVTGNLQPGITEREIAWELEKSMREQGAESTSFDIIVGSGPNGARPHHRPSDRIVEFNEPIVVDMGARLGGYCSDLTRTHYLGKADDRYKRVYDTVLLAQETAISAMQAGMTGHEVDKLARDVIEGAGFGDNFGHGTGHGVGLNIHEGPRVSREMTDELKDGMVFTVEPGIYLNGWGGVRIEDIVVMEGGRARDLTKAPKGGVLAG